MNANRSRRSSPRDGFTLVEIMIAVGMLLVVVLAATAIIVPLNRQREQVETLQTVMSAAKSQMEEIKGADPMFVELMYDGRTYNVPGIDGANTGGSVLEVTVDSTTPSLLVVTITAAWNVLGHVESFDLETEIYNPGP